MTATNLSGLAFLFFFLAIIILPFCVWLYALVKIYKNKKQKNRWLILLIVFVTFVFGALIYLVTNKQSDE